ncbi:MAG: membrane protein insertase YidC, partial [Pseudolabrys sp.]|nr:membrane protein insertase YidC [Pseudolabrys sp.]
MNDQKNTVLAIVLSALVLIAWQFFYGMPQLEKQKQIQADQQQAQQGPKPQAEGATQPQPSTTPQPGTAPRVEQRTPGAPGAPVTRATAIAASPRVAIQTPNLTGSINRKGARIDDLSLSKYRETVDPKSPPIVLLSPSGGPEPYYADFGWTGDAGSPVKTPNAETVWTQQGGGTLTPTTPVTLTYDNGEGLEFRRTFAVDDKYLFSVKDEIVNTSSAPAKLYPYALVSRHGTPHTLGYYILHEGPIAVLGENGLQEKNYKDFDDKDKKEKEFSFSNTKGWLGFTDKYWATALVPDPAATLFKASFLGIPAGNDKTYQASYLLAAQTVAPGATATTETRLFAGAKEVQVIDQYEKQHKIDRFDRLIDWGWFYFITKPLFKLIDFFFHLFGNFGIAILLVTVVIKIVFFPLANKSYASMAKMKAIQPEMMAIRERYADDKMKQQQAMMELYKKEQINPVAGCLPIAIQIPVFFSLYKVLFVTIDLRHAPFFGWIRDLSAPDPLTVFNLFGLIPWDPTVVPLIGQFLHLGPWP